MSNLTLSNFRLNRGKALATVAVVALVSGGVATEISLTSSTAARAAQVDLSGLQKPSEVSFAPLIERVKPAVVSIKVMIANVSNEGQDPSGQFGNLPPEIQRFFKQFGSPNSEAQGGGAQQLMGEGSGFFVSADGYVVTNNHVVHNAKTVTVTTDDGKTLAAKVVGTDTKTDLAVLKVESGSDYPFVTFASQAPRVGDWVVAIGNPYGLGGTATAGIISAQGRDIGDGSYDQYMQIDAPINRGNSGGPTFNTQGQVVGVNTAIYSPSGGSVGIGFDIPATTVSNVVEALEHGGVVKRGYLGVEIQAVTPDIASGLGLSEARGALVDKVMPGEPAAAAGLKTGDVITKLNGEQVKDSADLMRRIGAMKPGDKADIAYLRDGSEKTAEISLAALQNEKTASVSDEQASPGATLGMTLAPAGEIAGAGDKGVAVVAVDPNGKAAEKGVTAGDVILQVGGKAVSTPSDVRAAMAADQRDGKKAELMQLHTAQGDHFIAFELPKAQG